MTSLTQYDPFFIGFEDLLSKLHAKSSVNFPPYNIFKDNDTSYGIELAVAGYSKDEISVSLGNGILEVSGTKKLDDSKKYIHKGISSRSFSRTFTVAETIEVTKAAYENGVLKLTLENKLPETKKIKTIPVA
jgi:molecular chaperone IbpA